MALRRYKEEIDCVSFGKLPKENRRSVETIKFILYDLGDDIVYDTYSDNPPVESQNHLVHGCYWNLTADLTGHDLVDSYMTEYIDFLIECKDKSYEELDAKVLFRCTALNRKEVGKLGVVEDDPSALGTKNFLKKELCRHILKSDGCVVVEVDISISGGKKNVWYPKKLVKNDTLMEMYGDAASETADVVFSVGESFYKAHKCVLAVQGKKLYELTNENDDETPIPILGTKAEIFKNLLDFIYHVKTPDITNEEMGKDLLVAADRFDCVPLKLYAESVLVDKFLSVDTTAELFTIADSYSCAYLKEAASNMFLENPKAVRESKGWSEMKESKELLLEMLGSISGSKSENELYDDFENNIDEFTVRILREELDIEGLELDGTRETLVKRLKDHLYPPAKKQKTN